MIRRLYARLRPAHRLSVPFTQSVHVRVLTPAQSAALAQVDTGPPYDDAPCWVHSGCRGLITCMTPTVSDLDL